MCHGAAIQQIYLQDFSALMYIANMSGIVIVGYNVIIIAGATLILDTKTDTLSHFYNNLSEKNIIMGYYNSYCR